MALFNTPKREVSEVRGRPNLVSKKDLIGKGMTHFHKFSLKVRDEFEESVVMSTYLVAFVICDFGEISNVTNKNINVSVIATPDKIDQVRNV